MMWQWVLPLVRIDMAEFAIGLHVLPAEMHVRANGLRWVDVVYAYPTGARPNWPFVPPPPITMPPGHRGSLEKWLQAQRLILSKLVTVMTSLR
jgi:hypothetical protein